MVADFLHERAVLLALGMGRLPFEVRREDNPTLFSLGHAVADEHAGELPTVFSNQHVSEPAPANAMLLLDAQRMVPKARNQSRQWSRHGAVEAQLVPHLPSHLRRS